MTSTIIFVFSLLAQIGPGDVTSPIGPSSANTTSGGYGGLDRSAANLGDMNAPFTGSDAMKSAGSSDTSSPSSSSGTSPAGTSSETPTATGASAVGGGTSGGTGIGSSTGGLR